MSLPVTARSADGEPRPDGDRDKTDRATIGITPRLTNR